MPQAPPTRCSNGEWSSSKDGLELKRVPFGSEAPSQTKGEQEAAHSNSADSPKELKNHLVVMLGARIDVI